MNKIAIIDMGSNTFHLIIARVWADKWEVLYRTHEAVKIGRGGINNGTILPEAFDRALTAMRAFRDMADAYGVQEIYAYGTSAIRNARNGTDLARRIEVETGIRVNIIAGDEEASLIFAGVQAALKLDRTSLVMDIGAGSVEFIVGSDAGVLWKKSFEIGAQRLVEKFQHHDPIIPDEIAAIDQYLSQALAPLSEAIAVHRPSVIVGSSGTFDTLSDIFCIRRGIALAHENAETPLTVEAFYEIYQELIQKDRAARMAMEGMIELRVDMIVAACCLIRFVLDNYHFTSIRVSSWSLKEGALAVISHSFT